MFRNLSFLVIASCVLFLSPPTARGQRPDNTGTAETIKQLKESGEYDSLAAAFKQARDADGLPEPEDLESGVKLYAPDAAEGEDFGWNIARDGDTLVVGARGLPGSGYDGAAYIFVRAGSDWAFQQKLINPDGPAASLTFGHSVAVSGNTVAISDPDQNGPSPFVNSGAVFVFVRSGTTWAFQAKLVSPSPWSGDYLGLSLTLEGNTVAAGSHNSGTAVLGEVLVFVRSGTAWSLQQTILEPAPRVNYFGTSSISISGNTLVIGASNADSPGIANTGAAYAFVRSGSTWTLQQKLLPSDAEASSHFGLAVSIDGDTVVIGCPDDDAGTAADQGSAYVFVRSGSSWTQQQKLTSADGIAGDHFGFSVKVRGNTVVAGKYNWSSSTPGSQGAAYAFGRAGSTWTQIHKLTPIDGHPSDTFGISLEIDGNQILVGSPDALDTGGFLVGAVYFFQLYDWLDEANKVSPDPGVSDYFGHSVAVNGSTAVIGSWGDTGWRGAAYVFLRSGTAWFFQQKLVASDGASNEDFGKAVSISGSTIAIGAPSDDIGANANQGSAYIFVKSGSLWLLQQKITAADGAASDNFAQSISLSGGTVAIGSPHDDNGALANQGSVYFYLRTGSVWNLQQKIAAVDGAAGDQLGFSVALENNTAVLGAPTDDFPGKTDQGSAYVYGRSGSTWTLRQKLVASDGAASEQFGYSVALQGATTIVGAPFDQIGSNVHQGSAYPFALSGATWIPGAKMTASDGAAFDEFGWSVAVEGTDAVIGARGDDIAGRLSQGSAYTFFGLGGVWSQRQQLVAADGLMDDQFGTSVAISGGKIVVGAPFAQVSTYDNAGRAYFYVKNTTAPSPRGTIAGTVKTGRGLPIKNAVLTLTDAAGETRQAITNAFGYYSFEGVPEVGPGEIMVLTVSSKSYSFKQAQYVVTAAESGEENWDFVSEP